MDFLSKHLHAQVKKLSDNGSINATNILQESNERINSKSDAVMENTEANGTIEWENMKERTGEWIHSVEHCGNESIDYVEHVEDESIDCSDSEIYHDTQTDPLLTEFSSIKSPPDITTDTMKNRNCKEGDPCGYFKQDTNTGSIDAQERPTEHGEEHTGNNESYSGNNLLYFVFLTHILKDMRRGAGV